MVPLLEFLKQKTGREIDALEAWHRGHGSASACLWVVRYTGESVIVLDYREALASGDLGGMNHV